MLKQLTTHVVGVDTHRDTHTFAIIVSATGEVVATQTLHADQDGYKQAVDFVDQHCSIENRIWALEGTGSYGAGLCASLQAGEESVVEVERPKRIVHAMDARMTKSMPFVLLVTY
jgi:transposase